MSKRIHKVLAAVAGIAALALGGSAFAQAQAGSQPAPSKAAPPATNASPVPGAENPGAKDGDTVQSGDQTTPDPAGSAGASEQPGSEAAGESAPNSDGPGGHADEANGGNASADHQVQGAE
jgi:hypothetical protein